VLPRILSGRAPGVRHSGQLGASPIAPAPAVLVFGEASTPTVLFGPGARDAHAIEEWVSLSDTAVVAQVLTEVAVRVCH
jgi:acetylornithine deacetylase/succinyl-diaminopimelate desuccinylase-like protein